MQASEKPPVPRQTPDLVVPAGSFAALKEAVKHGADCVYIGLRNATNARNFIGLNFSEVEAADAVRFAHVAKVKVLLALNTYPAASETKVWQQAIDLAAQIGIDAVILADPGLMDYARRTYPQLRLHLSVQGSATHYEAINFYHEHFGISRAVLPRVLSLQQVEQVIKNTPVEIEVFGFGSLCVMVEGRCALSSFATGESPNMQGVCSPAKAVRWEHTVQGLESRLNGIMVDCYGENEKAAYPTICKGRFAVDNETYYAIEEPTSLNTLEILPNLIQAGIAAIKLEGRQRSPAYVGQVTQVWREAIDSCMKDPQAYQVQSHWMQMLNKVAEGSQHTLGAYHRSWR